jgi:dihydrolipoamide dehydrogenase
MKSVIIEKYPTLGGTCLNVGCIPSKALLDSSHHYEDAVKHFEEHGIEIPGEIKINLEKMIGRKQAVVDQTTKGIEFLMDKNKIEVRQGLGSFKDATHVNITKDDGSADTIEAKHIIIATGSKPSTLPFITVDKERIITSTEALKLKEIPKHMIVVGGGVIGLELGQVYKRLGAEVTVVEYMDRIVPVMDAALSKELMKVLKKQKVKFALSHKVKSVVRKGNIITVKADDKKGNEVIFEGDYCLVSVGRSPFTKGLNLEAAGVKLDDRGRVAVDGHLKTNVDNIYAIGDVVKGAMLAHKAEEEGTLVAEQLAGQKPHIDYNLIPNVVYTWPEVASVGKTEEELKEAGVDKTTDEVLGAHMIGARCADLITEAVTAMEFRASAEDIARMSHAHPTYAEAVKEAALAATDDRALHI